MYKIFFALLTVILVFSSSVEAAKVDIYREALRNNKFTLKYEVKELPILQTSKDAFFTYNGLRSRNFTDTKYLLSDKGIIVSDGDTRYIETFHKDYIEFSIYMAREFYNLHNMDMKINEKNISEFIEDKGLYMCELIKDGEDTVFSWSIENGKKIYGYGIGSSRMTYQGLVKEYSFGTSGLTRAFMPILPKEKIIAMPDLPDYKFFSSGSLDKGLTYEDFISDKNNVFSAIRYYFKGNDMIKISLVSYVKDGGKILSYEKSVINITEFSTTPDQSYFTLPAPVEGQVNFLKKKAKDYMEKMGGSK